MGLNDNDWPERPERDPEAYTEEEIEKLLETAAGTFRGLQHIDDKKKHDRLLLWALLRAARWRIVYLTRRESAHVDPLCGCGGLGLGLLLNQPYQFIQQPDQFPLLLWIEAKISAPLHMICANVGMLDGLFPALRQG